MPDAPASNEPTVVFDDSAWPVLSVRFKRPMTNDEFGVYLEGLKAQLDRAAREQKKVAIVMDSTIPIKTPREQQVAQAQWMKDHDELLRNWSIATAFVLTSAMSRFVLSMILLIQPLATGYKVFGEVGEAEAWARSLLA